MFGKAFDCHCLVGMSEPKHDVYSTPVHAGQRTTGIRGGLTLSWIPRVGLWFSGLVISALPAEPSQISMVCKTVFHVVL